MVKKKKKKIKKNTKKIIKKSSFLTKKTLSPNTAKTADKIEIKKIKKQPSEKRIFNINNYVVYPKHGVGKIIAVEKAKIGNIEIVFYKESQPNVLVG